MQDGATTIFTYAFWVPGSILAAGVVATVVGVLVRKHTARFGWALLILGPLAVFGFAPSLTERVPINDLMKEGANDKILSVARERNIPLVDMR